MEYHMETVSVVCCYNNDIILNTMLEESVGRQTNVTVERLYYNGEFKSAAEAYNYAIDHSQSDYLVFVHQDIKFVEDDFLYQMVEIIKKNPDAIYGLCGATIINGSTVTFSNVYRAETTYVRPGRNATITVNVGSGRTIKKVVIHFASEGYTYDYTVTTGSTDLSGTTWTWTGSAATSLVITNGYDRSSRISSIDVTYQE